MHLIQHIGYPKNPKMDESTGFQRFTDKSARADYRKVVNKKHQIANQN